MSEANEIKKRIVIYPVNVGDTVFCLQPGRKSIAEAKVESISVHHKGVYTYFYLLARYRNTKNENVVLQRIYGITAFKDLESAEKELCYK